MIHGPYLEALVLQHSLDGRIFAGGGQFGLKDDAKRAVAYYLALRILHLFGVPRQAILHLLANDLCNACQPGEIHLSHAKGSLPPMRRPENADGLLEDMCVWVLMGGHALPRVGW